MRWSQRVHGLRPFLLLVLVLSSRQGAFAGRPGGKSPSPASDSPSSRDTDKPELSPSPEPERPQETSPELPEASEELPVSPSPSPAVAVGAGACPAGLLPYLQLYGQQQQPINTTQDEQDQQPGAQQAQKTDHKTQQSAAVWPPPALKQGLTCTMEVSHLAIAMPGTATVCSVFRITNNLQSVLYSWQLIWEPSVAGGLKAVGADGAEVTPNTEDGSIRIINTQPSPEISSKGGVDFVVQMELPEEVRNSNDGKKGNTPSSGKKPHISPGIAAIYLNGLLCTRLPLMPSYSGDGGPGGSSNPSECTATRWPLTADGLFEALPGASNSSDSTSEDSSIDTAAYVAKVLNYLSCSAHYCCGLQVVPTAGNTTIESQPSVAAFGGPSNASNSTQANVTTASAPPDAATITVASSTPADSSGLTNATTNAPTELPPPVDALAPINTTTDSSSGRSATASIIAGVVVGVITAIGIAAVTVLLVRRHRQVKHATQQLSQMFLQEHVKQLPHLTTAAAERAISSGSSDSDNSAQGAAITASYPAQTLPNTSIKDWQQVPSQMRRTQSWQQRPYVPPYHTSPVPYVPPGGGVWRAGSWQGPEGEHNKLPLPGHPLLRSSSSPQTLQEQQAAGATQQKPPAQPAPVLAFASVNSPRKHNATGAALYVGGSTHGSSGLWRAGSGASAASRTSTAAPSSAARGKPAAGRGAAAGTSTLQRGVSGVSNVSSQSSSAMLLESKAPGGPALASQSGQTSTSTGGSTWGSLRRFFGSHKPPKSSTMSPGSSLSTVGMAAYAAATQGHSTVSTVVTASGQTISCRPLVSQQQTRQLAAVLPKPQLGQYANTDGTQTRIQQLQLIQETAPLAAAQLAAATSPDLLLRHHIGRHHQQPHGLGPAGSAGGGALLPSVSRRISPILSVVEDRSSATSNDSLAGPASWHMVDKQLLLDDTPGWLNIDFAREVRLEKKLGEGGFGQVFRARWRDEIIAAKLVPFMSLAAHAALPITLVSAEHGANSHSTAGLTTAAGSNMLSQPHGSSALHSTEGVMMGVGMQFSAASLRAIKMEIKVLSQLSHPNIVAFKGACLAPPHICILEELAEAGSLYSRLYSRSSRRVSAPAAVAAGSRRRSKAGNNSSGSGSGSRVQVPLSIPYVLSIAIDVASAMVYLHNMQPQVVHRDLKPQNVLLDHQGKAKVCDFGISKMRDASLAASSTRMQAGTPAYMAPEQFEGCSATEKVDVFSFAVLLWECCEQQQPWRDLSPMQIIYAVGLQEQRLGRPARCPDGLWQLIEACWQQQPELRPSFSDILATLKLLQQQFAHLQPESHARQEQREQFPRDSSEAQLPADVQQDSGSAASGAGQQGHVTGLKSAIRPALAAYEGDADAYAAVTDAWSG